MKAIAGISTTRPVKFFNGEDAEVPRGKTGTENEIGEAVLGAAMKVHSAVGPEIGPREAF